MTQKRILLVEDNENILLAMSTFLGMKGYDVREAKSCEEARSAITESGISVTITDLNLPDGKGEDLLVLADHPVIAMTGHVDDATRARIKEKGFAAFLGKPASLTEILATLESVMSEPKVSS